ncbi:hypothetical protein HDA32_000535 [Spinactinospora alkalitolerans]|uniref:Exo-alpha-sialidase n=1 Tax=Spinactinospora alkalitolerans TaxID=687207 RepID=A0A852TP81_9ACTN|nr:sialidase family protein [Spinactinospora alkalitolerans]NYE45415.1 hypothetical protein [Spinactinospora alkalitolerans]
MSRSRTLIGAATLAMLMTGVYALPAEAEGGGNNGLGPVAVSGESPFEACPGEPGAYTANAETEPWIAVNPLNPRNIAVAWQQDRMAGGSSRGIVVAASHDGGDSWESTPLPGFDPCALEEGDPSYRGTNPYLSFTADGALIASVTSIGDTYRVVTVRSDDGGRSWDEPVLLVDDPRDQAHDKQSTTADPDDPDRVYAVWNAMDIPAEEHTLLLARSDDGGRTWEEPRSVYRPEAPAGTVGAQILVQPDGSLLSVFFESDHAIGGPPSEDLPEKIRAIRSTDGGDTWSDPVTVADIELNIPLFPDTGEQLVAPGLVPDVAMDPKTGAVYAVWADAGISTSGSAIGISASTDGGRTWTESRRIDKTPDSPYGGTGQSFLPQVEVDRRGRVAVTYYDFRRDTPAPGVKTDVWAAVCDTGDCVTDDRSKWDESHIGGSYKGLEDTSRFFGGPFIGTYTSLATNSRGFLAAYTAPTGNPDNPQDIVVSGFRFRR